MPDVFTALLFTARWRLGMFETAGQMGAARIILCILPGKDRAFANGIMMSRLTYDNFDN